MPYRAMLGACLLFISALLAAEPISYSRDIQPIFTGYCVACHACYDAPCQLNLGSAEGVERGANRLPVYDGKRLKAQDSTRLFLDAHGSDAWRRKGFFSVLEQQGSQAALLTRMLELGHSKTLKANAKLPDGLDISIRRDNQCPRPDQFTDFARENPQAGMPFAVTGLGEVDYQTLQRWLQQGAPVDRQALEASKAEAAQVETWERFLNAPGARESLVSRWLYEHLFLAHLYFSGGEPGHFFQLLRSRTPSGQAVDPIATRRPNDDPGSTFYYRLTPVQGVIVHKTHMTYPLSANKLARVKQLFFADDWQVEALPGYGAQRRANPFETFAAIPPQARYQFMLDNAEYFVRTFIRGPVCRGQIATDVIRDNFWVVFQDPRHDLYMVDAKYRAEATPLLAMPGQFDDIGNLFSLWRTYRNRRNEYEALRMGSYAAAPAPSWAHIWAGNDNALLSVFRQHDSASVRKGLIGEIPQTLWWMDYPLLERTYYQLVVNFDVFGNLSHQAQTRLYFDLIRNGAEQALSRLTGKPAGGLKVIHQLPEATLLRVELADGQREVYSLLRNRAHSNVAFMYGEQLRYQPALDTLTVYPGVLTSYPNFIFSLAAQEVPQFVRSMESARDGQTFDRLVERWGIRRSHPEFWRYFHDLSAYIRETEPVEAGVLDMNRYENL